MKTIYFSIDQNILDEWINKAEDKNFKTAYNLESLEDEIKNDENAVVIVDFDTASHETNKLISLNKLPKNTIVLEKSPQIQTGKKLIGIGVKAYGNSRMSKENFNQMFDAVKEGKTWTYPKLTASLVSKTNTESLSEESLKMIQNRLTQKEIEIVYLILKGLTNDAIAQEENITTRTVKAHVSSIFSKLHVNDRVSLILLLK